MEMLLLTACDEFLITAASTFGGVAALMSGQVPFFIQYLL